MAFDFRAFLQFIHLSIFRRRGGNSRLTPKRIGWLLLIFFLFPPFALFTHTLLGLDELLFRRYRQIEIREPVFILGNFRSGTTFLHRLLARDTGLFSAMELWEIFFAPSIILRRFGMAVIGLDRRLGHPIHRLILRGEARWQASNVIHKASLRSPEEDEYLLTHIWSTLAVWLNNLVLEGGKQYVHFDTELPEADKTRIMEFYHRAIQRHLYARGDGEKRYLAKNPYATPKIETLLQRFPDARFIYLARNPLDALPSLVSMMEFGWRFMADPLDPGSYRRFLRELVLYWYEYPLGLLARQPEERYIIVKYNDLISDVEGTVTRIYERLGLPMSPEFAQILREEAEKAQQYRSRHRYSLQRTGLTRRQLVAHFRWVFDRFEFSRTQSGADL